MLWLLIALQVAVTPDSGAYTSSGLWYRTRGRGPDVVLIHGANLDSRSFAPLREQLLRSHRVTEVDLRFHGKTRDGEGPFSFEGDVLGVMDEIGLTSAALIGHSLGAMVAVDLALAAPARVERLALLAPSVSGLAATRAPVGLEGLGAAVRGGDMDKAADILTRSPVFGLFNDTSRRPLLRSVVRDNVRLFLADRARSRPLGAPAAERLSMLRVPTLVMIGSRDPSEAGLAVERIASHVPHAIKREIAGCGHILPLDCPDATWRALREFLRR